MSLEDIIALIEQGVIRIETEFDGHTERVKLHIWEGQDYVDDIREHGIEVYRYLRTQKKAPVCYW